MQKVVSSIKTSYFTSHVQSSEISYLSCARGKCVFTFHTQNLFVYPLKHITDICIHDYTSILSVFDCYKRSSFYRKVLKSRFFGTEMGPWNERIKKTWFLNAGWNCLVRVTYNYNFNLWLFIQINALNTFSFFLTLHLI